MLRRAIMLSAVFLNLGAAALGQTYTQNAQAIVKAGGGTMAQQNASSVAITGGTINGTTIGGTTPSTGSFTSEIVSGTSTVQALAPQYIQGQSAGAAIQFQSAAFGSTLMTVGTSYENVTMQTDLDLTGGTWGTGSLRNNVAPLYQNQTFTGTCTSGCAGAAFGAFLQQTDNSNVYVSSQQPIFGFFENLIVNGSNAQGGTRIAGQFNITDTNSNFGNGSIYTALGATAIVNHTDGTTGATAFGFNPTAICSAGITCQGVLGTEEDLASGSGSTLKEMIGHQIVLLSSHSAAGSISNIGYLIGAQYGAANTIQCAYCVGGYDGYNALASGATILGAWAHATTAPGSATGVTVTNGVDFRGLTFTGYAFASNGFNVDPNGVVGVNSTISLGTGVAGGGNAYITTPNGSNIYLNPQGGYVDAYGKLVAGTAALSGVALSLQNTAGTCTLTPTATTASFSCSSDRRLKAHITDTHNALDYLDSFRVRDYTVKASGERVTGVIAQEVKVNHPEMVHKQKDGMYAVDGIEPWKLVAAIQELEAEVKALKAELHNRPRQQ